MIFKFGELFCGPGGLAYAAKSARVESEDGEFLIEHAWATDLDKDTCDTYRKNICPHEPETVVCSDIRKLELSTLEAISDIDGLAFGFPCNDFSVVGEQKGIEGVYGPLYAYGVKTLKHFKPKWFLAENVGGLRNSNDGNALSTILEELSNAGYRVVPHLYKFEKYGVPQARHRIIIVGIRNDVGLTFKVPSPDPFKEIDVTAGTALTVPPIPSDAPNQERTKQSQAVIDRLKHIMPGQNAFNADIPKELQLNVNGARMSMIYRRLHPKKPAYTVTGSGGGGTYIYHWDEERALTNRERARLQTFPDTYEFCGSSQSIRKQIGMAVPPRGVRVIFESILKTFAGIEYESVAPNIVFEQPLFRKSAA